MNKGLFIILAVFAMSACNKKKSFMKSKDASETHIEFANVLQDNESQNILDYLYYYNGGGVAIGDINNDSLPDIYFTSNQGANKLYLNKGNLKFEDITEKAGVAGENDWSSGVTMADVNQDGLLDIYVCSVVGINGFEGANELYINNGNLTFTEQAAKYGLDIDNYSSNAAFFDYDLDGDLDMYLLNHAVHTQESFGDTLARHQRNYETGDKLFRNDKFQYTDISEEAGILGGVNGYGLGISIADYNQDGWPDIYVGNDFHEDDYYYVNQGDGTFQNQMHKAFGHCSKFTMGMDNADINHDGYTDLITLDMLSEDPKVVHSSVNDDNFQLMQTRTKKLGFMPQYARNMLQINEAGMQFAETALLSGVAATDWSWSALFADFNQDGNQDLYVSNGIPKRPNDLDYIQFISNQDVKTKINHTNLIDKQALDAMPEAKIKNYFFLGKGNGAFTNSSWATNEKEGITNGAAYVDLDNDGDLDLVLNNLNAQASILENTISSKDHHYLKVALQFVKPNLNGIGTKVFLYHGDSIQYKELFPVRGFQSTSQSIIHFGCGKNEMMDSLKIIWPNKTFQTITNVPTNRTLNISFQNAKPIIYPLIRQKNPIYFQEVTDQWQIESTHQENDIYDFQRHKLIPYAISTLGPALAVGDLNNDGKEDIFLGGAKNQPSTIWLQNDQYFQIEQPDWLVNENKQEDVAALILDIDQNQETDLLIAEGGGEFFGNQPVLKNKYFLQEDHVFRLTENPYFDDASVLKTIDFDQDGDLDLFVGSAYDAGDFGTLPTSYILENQSGKWVKKVDFLKLGMIRDAVITDFNQDGTEDILVVGEWMQPKVILNHQNNNWDIISIGGDQMKGLWRAVSLFDIDQDGDQDICLGNWGLNSKFNADSKHPLLMYHADFDHNKTSETLLANYSGNDYYSFYGLQQLQEQIPEFRKTYTQYKNFASKDFNSLLTKKQLKDAELLQVDELASGYLQNNNGEYRFVPFENSLQIAPINCFVKTQIKGRSALIAGGNFFGLTPYQGRFDGFSGALIFNSEEIWQGYQIGLNLFNQQIAHMEMINIKSEPYLVVAVNNGRMRLFKMIQN